MTKMGMQRTLPPREPVWKISGKQQEEIRAYNKLRLDLLQRAGFKSELSGQPESAEWGGNLEIHHISGRIGKRMLDPFNLIILTAKEHWLAQETMSWENKRALLNYIRPVRLAQGFKDAE